MAHYPHCTSQRDMLPGVPALLQEKFCHVSPNHQNKEHITQSSWAEYKQAVLTVHTHTHKHRHKDMMFGVCTFFWWGRKSQDGRKRSQNRVHTCWRSEGIVRSVGFFTLHVPSVHTDVLAPAYTVLACSHRGHPNSWFIIVSSAASQHQFRC